MSRTDRTMIQTQTPMAAAATNDENGGAPGKARLTLVRESP